MSSDETHENALATIVDRRDKPVFVSADIEHHAIIGKNVGAPKHPLDIGRVGPICRPGEVDPGP
jgi:hypothetical protein